ncbi:protein tyrosine phosphatase [Paenibacillus yonginensis]|uniref:Protein tyrosine phosphatase n=1 Tax=Paenibacillus yonginensis TaxID=1462996 RepID=A0A1B1N438_9BACL|nr:low molecular weight protein arginine phosphatase [Paenibacillus yonginensis]ANS76155.1 protein tyrosine phosphatase [Paenibacillus yonginensis]
MRILFVCTGNTCRSPMAEGMFRQMALEAGLSAEVKSAGVAAIPGMSISRHAEAVLRDHQITDRLTSTAVSEELVNWADMILTLTQGHKRQLLYAFPDAASKTYVLKEYVDERENAEGELQELDGLLAERALQAALGGRLTEEDSRRITELQQRIPVYDISDPFGGSREDYEKTAAEIREALEKLLHKLLKEREQEG